MNARRLEIARRLVACPKWVWLPGMAAAPERKDMAWCGTVRIHGHETREDGGHFLLSDVAQMRDIGRVPDLDDDLTRLGVLAVVRRACGHLACVESPAVSGLLRLSTDSAPWRVHFRGGIAIGDTEEEALLSALESAS